MECQADMLGTGLEKSTCLLAMASTYAVGQVEILTASNVNY